VATIIQLIKKYWNIILFLMLQLFCIRMIMKSNTVQGNDLLNSSNAIAGFFYEKQNQVVSYFQMGSLNKALLAENTKLKNQLNEHQFFDTTQNMIAKVPLVVYDTIKPKPNTDTTLAKVDTVTGKPIIVQELKPVGVPRIVQYASYNYIAAKVINNSVSNDKNNYITINKGSADGIEKDMAVVSAEGVVGRVAYVSKHYAAIISVLSTRPVSAQVAGGNVGVSSWDFKSPEYVNMGQVDSRTPVKKGDTAYTTGYSFFPENLSIGIVTKVDTVKVNNTLNLKLRLINNFRNLKYVYVVANKIGPERAQLEKEVAQKEKEQQEKNKQ
jgi:rod shape-determining protein MreC